MRIVTGMVSVESTLDDRFTTEETDDALPVATRSAVSAASTAASMFRASASKIVPSSALTREIDVQELEQRAVGRPAKPCR